MKKLYCDLETYSEVPISYGTHRYAENCEILLWGYAVDEEPARVWDRTQDPEMPADLRAALDEVMRGERDTVWHNGMMFDTVVLQHHGIDIPLERIIDTMVIAYQHGLPGALGDLCDVLRLGSDKAKDKDGRRLVGLFCKPLPVGSRFGSRATKATHPADWARFVNYCRLDVEAERELFKRMPSVNCTKQEHELQVLDAVINRRGMLMDRELARAAVALDAESRDGLAKQTREATGGAVQSATQRDALLKFLEETYGWKMDSMTKAEVEKRVDDPEVPEPVRELLKLRLASTKTSIRKFTTILNATSSDGRLRGCLQFRGAARTGRWSGRTFQPQNLARPSMGNSEIDWAIDRLKDGTFDLWYDSPSTVLPNLLRGEIISQPGGKLVVADYSNVEGRVLAWLAGESWKLKAFKDFDEGHGHDLYKLTYGRTFNVKPELVTKSQRQMGKVLELALGYGGGAGAFVTFARGYGIDLDAMAATVRETIDPALWQKAEESYDFFVERKLTAGLTRDVFLACDAVKRAWRNANPHIVGFWNAVDTALVDAVVNGEVGRAGEHVAMAVRGSYLLVRLPSGRKLCYPSPRVAQAGSDDDRFSYMGVEQYSRKWKRIRSYASKVVENITQAVSCDLLAAGLVRLEAAGYKTVLTVHDEAITEAPDTDDYSYEKMERLMSALPPWAEGLPLVAAGYEAYRYKKD